MVSHFIEMQYLFSPVSSSPATSALLNYDVTGVTVGITSVTCQAVSLSGEVVASKPEEVQVCLVSHLKRLIVCATYLLYLFN